MPNNSFKHDKQPGMKCEYRPVGLARSRTWPFDRCEVLLPPENSPCKPDRRDKNVDWIGEKGWFVAFDEVSQPGQCKCGRDQQQRDDPMPPDDDHRKETDRNRDHVQGTVHWMSMRAVIVRI